MNRDKDPRADLRALCGSLHPDDLCDPRKWNDDPKEENQDRESLARKRSRKQLGLAREAERVLTEVFAGELSDGVLQDLEIARVEPLEGGRLQVTVRGRQGLPTDPGLALDRLKRLRPYLRQELARAIRRKKAPELAFQFTAGEEGDHE